jgi:hypothetical protein
MQEVLKAPAGAGVLNDADLTLIPVRDLLKARFFIPAYQRGYRWTDIQVEQLLNDMLEFKRLNGPGSDAPDAPFYCLQPVVVKKRLTDGGIEWEVIDGQQRLTTILIILHYFNKTEFLQPRPLFHICYQTRPDSGTFLANIENAVLAAGNIDYHHMHLAYQTISGWFGDLEEANTGERSELYPILVKNIKVIWYQVDDSSGRRDTAPVEVFTRLNIGKIPLTNSELIKALFLQRSKLDQGRVSSRQLQIATEWDLIEKQLQDDAFWYFIYDIANPLKYENRIEYIFDLIKNRQQEDEHYFTFNRFAEELSPDPGRAGLLWTEVKKYFLSFEEWFGNKEFYHLVGFLVDCRVPISTLKEATGGRTKRAFRTYLDGLVHEEVAGDIAALDYRHQNTRKVLLLFNIQTLLATQNADFRFPFYRYKKENWDIEHVRSRTAQQIAPAQRQNWLVGVLEYCSGADGYGTERLQGEQLTPTERQEAAVAALRDGEEKLIALEILRLLPEKKIGDTPFEALYRRISLHFREHQTPGDIDHISNLALLDSGTNRSYKNAMFPVKRKRILDNDKNGVFVPICTRNLFLKSYSARMTDLIYWEAGDAADYLQAIRRTLEPYLKEPEPSL